MAAELFVATLMVVLTVVVHAAGLSSLQRRLEGRIEAERRSTLRRLALTVLLALCLFALHGFEIWLYAGVYQGVGAVPDLRQAAYLSASAYGAIGFSDADVAEPWRLLAAIEGINGILLLGWTTALFVTLMNRLHGPRA
ncbi:MAG: hypothetical protein B7Y99_08120 [Caulobacterales bacterium 32-69-10]|nr:MAG: hypothetical protein B7Y99_08120 [Caulobacterales bacterium 32-69-10]